MRELILHSKSEAEIHQLLLDVSRSKSEAEIHQRLLDVSKYPKRYVARCQAAAKRAVKRLTKAIHENIPVKKEEPPKADNAHNHKQVARAVNDDWSPGQSKTGGHSHRTESQDHQRHREDKSKGKASGRFNNRITGI